jgi:hypothetical protein
MRKRLTDGRVEAAAPLPNLAKTRRSSPFWWFRASQTKRKAQERREEDGELT